MVYSLAQVLVLWIVVQGVNLADAVWEVILVSVDQFGSIVSTFEDPDKDPQGESLTDKKSDVETLFLLSNDVLHAELCYQYYTDQATQAYQRCVDQKLGNCVLNSPKRVIDLKTYSVTYTNVNPSVLFPVSLQTNPPVCNGFDASDMGQNYPPNSDPRYVNSRFNVFLESVFYPMSTVAKSMYQRYKNTDLCSVETGVGCLYTCEKANGVVGDCYIGEMIYSTSSIYSNGLDVIIGQREQQLTPPTKRSATATFKKQGWISAGFAFNELITTKTQPARMVIRGIARSVSTPGDVLALKFLFASKPSLYTKNTETPSQYASIQLDKLYGGFSATPPVFANPVLANLSKYIGDCAVTVSKDGKQSCQLNVLKTSAIYALYPASVADQPAPQSFSDLIKSNRQLYKSLVCIDPFLHAMFQGFVPGGCYSNPGEAGGVASFFAPWGLLNLGFIPGSYAHTDISFDQDTQWFIRSIGASWMQNFGLQAENNQVMNPIGTMRNFGIDMIVNSVRYLSVSMIDIYYGVIASAVGYLQKMTLLAAVLTPVGKAGDILTNIGIPMAKACFEGGGPIMKIVCGIAWLAQGIAVVILDAIAGSVRGIVESLSISFQMEISMKYRWLPVVAAATSFLIGYGSFLAFYVPVIPLMVFLLASIGWFLAVIEATIAAPVVAVGMAYPMGHDFLGRAENTMLLLFSVFIRPFTILAGFIFAIMLAWGGMWLLNNIGMLFLSDYIANLMSTQPIPLGNSYLSPLTVINLCLHRCTGD